MKLHDIVTMRLMGNSVKVLHRNELEDGLFVGVVKIVIDENERGTRMRMFNNGNTAVTESVISPHRLTAGQVFTIQLEQELYLPLKVVCT